MPVANVGGVGDAIGPQEWFQSLPFVTRTWFGASVLITVATNFGVFSPMQMIFLWPAIYEKFELWRLATSFLFVGSFDFGTLIALYLLVQFSKQYEAGGPFNTGAGGGTADYAFAIIFAVVMILITYPVVSSFARVPPMFARNLIYFVLYIWSRRNPDANANIWGE
jgi:Derlin-2/3